MLEPGTADARWVPPGRPATVGAHVIPGGLIYVGRHLRAPAGGVEPALINPDLPAPAGGPIVEPGPGPAYHLLPAATRAAYLAWLAGGRDGDVPAGLVLLFCSGLERRVLIDADHDPAVRRELPAIAAEVGRLRARYLAPALRAPLERLHDLLVLLAAPRAGRSVAPAPPVPPSPDDLAVRVALAGFAAASRPVPADWARAWVRHHPTFGPRSVRERCPEEFDRLFALRYRQRHGAGVVPPDDAPGIRLRYQPASPGLTATLVCREDLPDVLAEPRGTRALGALVDDVAAALDPYRRWLARFPRGRGSLAAVTVLPAELVDPDRGQLGALRVWAEAMLDGRPRAVIDAAEFGAFWSTATPERMARDEAAALLGVLAVLGLGVEPDVRFGAPALAAGPAVLFRPARPPAARPGPRFPSAAAVARCAVAVASAAGPVDPTGQVGTAVLGAVRELAPLLRLDPGEDARLLARSAWLLATGVDLDRLGRQTARLDAADRELAGRHLVAVATVADPAVGPATVATLTRVYRILGLEPGLVFPRLHEQSLGRPAAAPRPVAPPPVVSRAPAAAPDPDGPATVRPADAVAHGYALPWAPAPPPPAGPGVRLDRATILRKLEESAVAATILTEIFDTDPPLDVDPPTAAPRSAGGADRVAGLDAPHSRLLRALADRSLWTREEFTSLAAAHGVLPEGAVDVLNEVAIDTCGAPVVEDDATLAVNDDVLQELLA